MWMKISLLLCLLLTVATTNSRHVNNNNADAQSETHHPTIKEKESGRNHGINDDDYLKALAELKASHIPIKNLGNVMASFKTNVHDPEHPKEHHDLQHLRSKRSNNGGGGLLVIIICVLLCCSCCAGIGVGIYFIAKKDNHPAPQPAPVMYAQSPAQYPAQPVYR